MSVLPPAHRISFRGTSELTGSLEKLAESISLDDFIISVRWQSSQETDDIVPVTAYEGALLAIVKGIGMGLPPQPIIVTVATNKGKFDVAISTEHVEIMGCRSRDQVCRILTELEKHIVGVHFPLDTLVEISVAYRYPLST